MIGMKTISVILISTVLGAATGFGLSYIILNGQIRGLQQNLATLGVTIGRIGDIAANMTTTIEAIADTITTGLANVSTNVKTRVDQLQAQLDILNSTISHLNSTITGTNEKRWHEVTRAPPGPVSPPLYQTDPFPLEGSKIQISWSMSGLFANATIIIQIYQPDGGLYLVLASSGYYCTFVNELTITEPGDYFLRILATDVDRWSIIVRDYY